MQRISSEKKHMGIHLLVIIIILSIISVQDVLAAEPPKEQLNCPEKSTPTSCNGNSFYKEKTCKALEGNKPCQPELTICRKLENTVLSCKAPSAAERKKGTVKCSPNKVILINPYSCVNVPAPPSPPEKVEVKSEIKGGMRILTKFPPPPPPRDMRGNEGIVWDPDTKSYVPGALVTMHVYCSKECFRVTKIF